MTGPGADLRALLDKQEIYEALARYCRGTDRCDGAAMASLFVADARVRHATFDGLAPDFVADYTGRIKGAVEAVQHALANVLVDLDGDAARSEASFVSYFAQGSLLHVFGGRYLDSWRRTGDGWKVVDRVTVHDWNTVVDRGAHVFLRPVQTYAQGAWYPEDPVYQQLR